MKTLKKIDNVTGVTFPYGQCNSSRVNDTHTSLSGVKAVCIWQHYVQIRKFVEINDFHNIAITNVSVSDANVRVEGF